MRLYRLFPLRFRGSGSRGTRGTSEIALGAGSGKTVRDRNQGRSSFDAAAAGRDLLEAIFRDQLR
jgi:hypothetical protein